MKTLRIFPSVTRATPQGDDIRYGSPELFDRADYDLILISVTFTWDLPRAEQLAKEWKPYGHVEIGGPATGQRGKNFTSDMFVKRGYVITSRGCDNRCSFCLVPVRDGALRELPITDGWNVLDDNLLACSPEHIAAVFEMLARQHNPIQFTGGLEAAKLTPTIAKSLKTLHPKQMFFAYDTPNDLEPLREAGRMLLDVGFTIASKALRCYVLIGYGNDTIEKAEQRLHETMSAGFVPMAMFYRDENGKNIKTREWQQLQRRWARPAIIGAAGNK